MGTILIIPSADFSENPVSVSSLKVAANSSVIQYIGYKISGGSNVPGPNATTVTYTNNSAEDSILKLIDWDDSRIQAAVAGGKSWFMGGMLRGNESSLKEVTLVASEEDVLCSDLNSFIGAYTFRDCLQLTKATINVKKFYPSVPNFFGNCLNLLDVNFLHSDFAGVDNNSAAAYSMFYRCVSLMTVDCSGMNADSINFIKNELTVAGHTFTDDGTGLLTITGTPPL